MRAAATAALSMIAVAAVVAAPPTGGTGFTDVTAAAGIRFRHNSGAFGKKYLPETMGAGVAFADTNSRLKHSFHRGNIPFCTSAVTRSGAVFAGASVGADAQRRTTARRSRCADWL